MAKALQGGKRAENATYASYTWNTGSKNNRSGRQNGHHGQGQPSSVADGNKNNASSSSDNSGDKNAQRVSSLSLGPHLSKGVTNFMRDCKYCLDENRKQMLDEYHTNRKAENGAKRLTHAWTVTEYATVVFSANLSGSICETL